MKLREDFTFDHEGPLVKVTSSISNKEEIFEGIVRAYNLLEQSNDQRNINRFLLGRKLLIEYI